MDWFIYSIGAVISFSLMAALYKLPAQKNQSKIAVTFWNLFFSFIFALLFFYSYLGIVDNKVILLACLWGIGFSSLIAIQMYLLEKININTLFPINTTFSLVISVMIGLLFFSEAISFIQGMGILIALVAIYLFLLEKGNVKYSKKIVKWIFIMVSLAVFSILVLKLAADMENIYTLQVYQYFFALIFSLFIMAFLNKNYFKKNILSDTALSGFYIAIPSFFGNWLLLIALSKGPFSLVASLHALYIFGASIFGYLFFKEKLTKKKISFLFLAILAILLIRIG